MTTDPIADLLTQLRNAMRAGHPTAKTHASKTKQRILQVLLDEGYIHRFETLKDATGKSFIKVFLRYTTAGKPSFQQVVRLSKPGRRHFVQSKEIPFVRGGLGAVVVSTSQGMMSDREARKRGVGGELICSVF